MPLLKISGAQRFRMPWGAVAGAAIGVAGNALTSKSNGGAGSSTSDKSPWAPAAGDILGNINTGQNLENAYLTTPQSSQQQALTNSIYGQTGYMQGLVPSLLGQLSTGQLGFDPSNPTAKPTAFNFGTTGSGAGSLGGLLASQQSPATATGTGQSGSPTVAAPATPTSTFVQQGNYDPASVAQQGGTVPTGGYGAFTYGSAMPAAGTQAYKDMNDYFAYGGNDPLNLYGKGNPLIGNTDASTKNMNSGGY